MASFLHSTPHLVLSAFPDLTRNPNPLLSRTHSPIFPLHKPFLRGAGAVARVGFRPDLFPDPESAQGVVRELLGRAESVLYTVADAAVSSTDPVVETKQSSDWFSGITATMESVLKVLKDGLSGLHVPYSYGFAIILLTFIVKAATFPLTKKQVESAMAMRSLQPQIQAIQQRYAGDQERIQLETARIYKLARINPLAGCLPTLLTIPVWIGLYRALSNVANEGLLTEGFFWIPSLSGPATIGSGTSWLFPFVDGHPPLGWSETFAYIVLPVLLIVSQYISVQIMQSSQGNDPNLKNSQVITKFVPLLIGYFALSVPSGLSLYWFTNNMLSTAQQVWLQKLGGARNPARDFSNIISKDDPSQIQKPILEKISAKEGRRQGEKLTPEGLRPGERFKQIKEQEERKRRQREEKKMTVEEVTASSSEIMNDGHKEEPKLVKTENGGVADLVNGVKGSVESLATVSESSNGVVNGGLSKQDSEEDEKRTSFIGLTSGRIPATEVDRGNAHHSSESLEQEDAVEKYTTVTATDSKLSGEDLPHGKREVHAEEEE